MIELVDEKNFEELLPLMEDYQKFYEVNEISTEKNRDFFSRFLGGAQDGAQFLYRAGNVAIGFATVYFTYSSAITSRVAVLNDLYIKPAFRRQGKARELIDHCLDYGLKMGAVRLQWLTAKTNNNAQTAYNKIGANRSEWVFYTYTK